MAHSHTHTWETKTEPHGPYDAYASITFCTGCGTIEKTMHNPQFKLVACGCGGDKDCGSCGGSNQKSVPY